MGNLVWPINLSCTSLDCGRKPEHLEETHADTGRMCKLHTDSNPSWEWNSGPWSCKAAVLTTVPPCCPLECSSPCGVGTPTVLLGSKFQDFDPVMVREQRHISKSRWCVLQSQLMLYLDEKIPEWNPVSKEHNFYYFLK